MALAPYHLTIQDEAGNAVDGATVRIRTMVPGLPLALLYTDVDINFEGITPLSNPFVAAASQVLVFLESGLYQVDVTFGITSQQRRYVQVGGAQSVDSGDIIGGITIDATGLFADRSTYDGEDPGFVFFAEDHELIYVRLTAGGWSSGIPLRGPPGIAIHAAGTFAERDGYDDEAQGFVYASTNGDAGATTTEPRLFVKKSGASADWSDPMAFQGPQGISGTSAFSVARVAAAENVDIATALDAGDTLNGVLLVMGDIVLLPFQDYEEENGLYVVQMTGPPIRHPDFATFDSFPGRYFSVSEGTEYADTLWRCEDDQGSTIDVDPINLTFYSPVRTDVTAELSVGYSAAGYDIGQGSPITTGTVTPDEANGQQQWYENGGAHILAPPVNDTEITLHIVNVTGAGVITTTALAAAGRLLGDPFTTDVGDEFMVFMTKNNGRTVTTVVAVEPAT